MLARHILGPSASRQIKRVGVRYQSNLAKTDFVAERLAVKEHAGSAAKTWKNITMFVCIPALLASGVNAYNLYEKHNKHALEHPREWVKYDYMNFRGRDFFWGKNSLFFNPKVNLSAIEDDE
ncbi:mitochondrial cytochrome c oxidase subunit VIa [Backusella circina FSU 941]|nr:mitochondrial cytochrome c oxidase subunit VIa [Backusella circina FSU 941]